MLPYIVPVYFGHVILVAFSHIFEDLHCLTNESYYTTTLFNGDYKLYVTIIDWYNMNTGYPNTKGLYCCYANCITQYSRIHMRVKKSGSGAPEG